MDLSCKRWLRSCYHKIQKENFREVHLCPSDVGRRFNIRNKLISVDVIQIFKESLPEKLRILKKSAISHYICTIRKWISVIPFLHAWLFIIYTIILLNEHKTEFYLQNQICVVSMVVKKL